MLRYFFEKNDQETRHLFKSLKIWQDEKYRALEGQFPVIFITFKDVKHDSWQATLTSLNGSSHRLFKPILTFWKTVP